MEAKTRKELETVATVTSVDPVKTNADTRRERLLKWAHDVETSCWILSGIHNIEHYRIESLRELAVNSVESSVLSCALRIFPGIQTANHYGVPVAMVGTIMDYLELSQDDLHRIDCYCHGDMHPSTVAARIRRVAGQPR